MYATVPSTRPVQSIFGAGYVPEHHVDHEDRMLPAVEPDMQFSDFVKSLRMLVSGEAATAKR